MSRTRPVTAAVATATAVTLVLAGTHAAAHKPDVFTAKRAGPIKVEETTLDQATSWFGDPTATKQLHIGCQDVTMARWGKRLKAYHHEVEGELVVAEVWLWKRNLTTDEHGTIAMRTRRGLRVGDTKARLVELYPSATRYKYKGRTFYELRPATPSKGRLRAVVKKGKVRALINAPWEYCAPTTPTVRAQSRYP
jgi:hypothetical protein